MPYRILTLEEYRAQLAAGQFDYVKLEATVVRANLNTKLILDAWENRPKRVCLECGEWPSEYMLEHDIWMQAVPDPAVRLDKEKPGGVHLCLACVPKRLGRDLTLDDFSDAPLNNPIRVGFALGRK